MREVGSGNGGDMRQPWLMILVVFLAALILSYRLNKPFVGHHDWNSVWFATIARNYLRYGLLETRLGQTLTVGEVKDRKELSYHTHHPPLLPLLMAGSFFLLGESEVSARLVALLASLVMVMMIYFIGQEVANKKAALLASLLTIVTPIFIYFGKLPVHETVAPAFLLLAFYHFIRLIKTAKTKHFLLLVFLIVLSQLTGWAGYYFSVELALFSLLFKQIGWRRRLWLLFLPVMMFLLHLLHVRLLTGSFSGGGLMEIFLSRLNLKTTSPWPAFSLSQYLTQEARMITIYYTRIVVVGSLLWTLTQAIKVWPFWQPRRWQRLGNQIFVLFLFTFGLTHLVLFTNLAFIHDYMIYYLLPFLAISSALFFQALFKPISPRWLRALLTVLLLAAVASERRDFLQALFATQEAEKGRQLGFLVKEKTEPSQITLVGSNHFGEFFEVFINYYGDRRVEYAEKLPPGWQKKYRLVVRPIKDHDALRKEDKILLDQSYVREENERFGWYDLGK